MNGESIKPAEPEAPMQEKSMRRIEEEINGVKYVFESIKYKKLKVMKKTAGEDAQLLNDLVMVECIKSPKTTIVDLDEMELAEIMSIQKVVVKLTGINPESVKGF